MANFCEMRLESGQRVAVNMDNICTITQVSPDSTDIQIMMNNGTEHQFNADRGALEILKKAGVEFGLEF